MKKEKSKAKAKSASRKDPKKATRVSARRASSKTLFASRKTSSPKRPARMKPAARGSRAKSVKTVAASNKRSDAPKPKLVPVEEHLGDLPFSYDKTHLVLMVRDPLWAYGYWDFSAETWNWIQRFFQAEKNLRSVLRVHNLDHGIYYDLSVDLHAKSWYLELGLPDTTFEVELGLLDASGHFHLIARSNRIRTPRNTPSDVIDPLWSSESFDEMYRLSGGGKTGHGSEIFSQSRRS